MNPNPEQIRFFIEPGTTIFYRKYTVKANTETNIGSTEKISGIVGKIYCCEKRIDGFKKKIGSSEKKIDSTEKHIGRTGNNI